MKKNGFIAMSLIYTFFIVFIVVLVSILDFYLDNNAIVDKINKEVIIRYNEGLDGKNLTTLYGDGILEKGDLVLYQTNNNSYNNGKWAVLKADINGVYLISQFITSLMQRYSYNLSYIRSTYNSTFLNPDLASNIYLLERSDLWPSSSQSSIQPDNFEYSIWNIGVPYFVADGSQVKLVAPNCSCSGLRDTQENLAYYAMDIPQFPSLADWYNEFCANYITSNYSGTILSECPTRYLDLTVNTGYVSGVRIVIQLKENVVLLGGTGSVGSPYLIGVIE